jgi:hypothetical protein
MRSSISSRADYFDRDRARALERLSAVAAGIRALRDPLWPSDDEQRTRRPLQRPGHRLGTRVVANAGANTTVESRQP